MKTIATRTELAQKVPLRLVLVILFVLQIFTAVGLVGYFYRTYALVMIKRTAKYAKYAKQ